MPVTLRDIDEFFTDEHQRAVDKNNALALLLTGTLSPHHAVYIERIEIGSRKGWRVVYRLA